MLQPSNISVAEKVSPGSYSLWCMCVCLCVLRSKSFPFTPLAGLSQADGSSIGNNHTKPPEKLVPTSLCGAMYFLAILWRRFTHNHHPRAHRGGSPGICRHCEPTGSGNVVCVLYCVVKGNGMLVCACCFVASDGNELVVVAKMALAEATPMHTRRWKVWENCCLS